MCRETRCTPSFGTLIFVHSGYDAPFHLSEECSNANIASPRAIVLTSGVGGLFGWFLQLVVAYTVIDIQGVLDSDLGQPWASYLLQVLPQKTAVALLSLTIMCAFSMGQGCMASLHGLIAKQTALLTLIHRWPPPALLTLMLETTASLFPSGLSV